MAAMYKNKNHHPSHSFIIYCHLMGKTSQIFKGKGYCGFKRRQKIACGFEPTLVQHKQPYNELPNKCVSIKIQSTLLPSIKN